MIMMHQCRFILGNKCTILVSDNGKDYACVEAGGIWKISIPSSTFCYETKNALKNKLFRASLVAQWLRICLPMQGTRVRALVWEDPTCHGATRPVSHNYWACASGACAPQQEAAIMRGPRTVMKSGPHLPQLEKALAQKQRPNTAINK